MSRAAVVTWAVALLLMVGIALAGVHAHSNRIAKCSHVGGVQNLSVAYPKSVCAEARTQEDQTFLAGGVGALVVVMGTGIALALQKRD
jgi:hypothetical protein